MKAQIVKRFEDEIQDLERELKTELPKEIKRARELGDLRENAEYQAAKDRQSYVQARIAMLRRRVAEIALLNLDRIPQNRVGLGSTVTLRGDGGDTVTYRLVMPEDADPASGLITTASPIGRALLNKEEGDDIIVDAPTGRRAYELVKLLTIHDGAP
jgi:transcription elongation factor GreA